MIDSASSRISSSRAHFRHLLVLEEGELVGVISDRDLFRAISPYLGSEAEMSRDTETLTKRAHQIMTRQPITIALILRCVMASN